MSARTWVEQKLAALVVRGLVSRVDDGLAGQSVQVRALKDEPLEAEHLLPYGFTAVPLPPGTDGNGAEALVLFLGGSRSAGVCLVVGDRRHRLTGNVAGEVAIYDDLGQRVHLKRDRITVTLAGANTLELGDGASLGVARTTDAIQITAATDATFWTWLQALITAWNAAAVAGGPLIVPAGAPAVVANITGAVTGGSATVRAV